MASAMAGVVELALLPVEVLMKSAPAAKARSHARRSAEYEPSSPASTITLKVAPAQAARKAASCAATAA